MRRVVRLWGSLVILLVFVVTLPIVVAYGSSDVVYEQGGKGNTKAALYQVPEGFPKIPPRHKYLGILEGSWQDMGRQYGQKAGDLIRLHFDGSWPPVVKRFGLEHALECLHRWEKEIAYFSPQTVDFIKGIAEGAAPEFDKSSLADSISHYEKALFISCIRQEYVLSYPKWSKEKEGEACSSIWIAPPGTKDGTTIIGQNMGEWVYGPHSYKVVYVAKPDDPDANMFIAEGYPGQLNFSQVNEKGVVIGITAGTPLLSKIMPREVDFAVPTMAVEFHACAYADSVEEAVDIITHGTDEYRKNTGRKILRGTGWNYFVGDRNNACVVETTANRYATRYPGDTGEDGKWLVLTNHELCDYSYNEDDEKTQLSMRWLGTEKPGVRPHNSTSRYYTHWWNIKYNYGKIDREMAEKFMSSHYAIHKDGSRHDHYWDEKHGWVSAHLAFGGSHTPCNHMRGYPERYIGGTSASKVMVIDDEWVTMHYTMGRPCEWEGPRDRVSIRLAH